MKENKFEKLQEFEILNIGMMDAVQGGWVCDPKYAGDACSDTYCWSWYPSSWVPEGLGHDGICATNDAGDWRKIEKKFGSVLPKLDDSVNIPYQGCAINDVTLPNSGGLSTAY